MDDELDGQAIKKLTIRVPVRIYLALDDLARAARIPVAAAARRILVNRVPVAAPPLAILLSDAMRSLIKVIHGLQSNLHQLSDHAARLGGPLAQLRGSNGNLHLLKMKVIRVGVRTKAGQVDEARAAFLLAELRDPANEVNKLARRLNQGDIVPVADWRAPLSNCAAALSLEVG